MNALVGIIEKEFGNDLSLEEVQSSPSAARVRFIVDATTQVVQIDHGGKKTGQPGLAARIPEGAAYLIVGAVAILWT